MKIDQFYFPKIQIQTLKTARIGFLESFVMGHRLLILKTMSCVCGGRDADAAGGEENEGEVEERSSNSS